MIHGGSSADQRASGNIVGHTTLRRDDRVVPNLTVPDHANLPSQNHSIANFRRPRKPYLRAQKRIFSHVRSMADLHKIVNLDLVLRAFRRRWRGRCRNSPAPPRRLHYSRARAEESYTSVPPEFWQSQSRQTQSQLHFAAIHCYRLRHFSGQGVFLSESVSFRRCGWPPNRVVAQNAAQKSRSTCQMYDLLSNQIHAYSQSAMLYTQHSLSRILIPASGSGFSLAIERLVLGLMRVPTTISFLTGSLVPV